MGIKYLSVPESKFVHIICPNGIIALEPSWIGDDARWNGSNWISEEKVEYWYCVGFYIEGSF